MPHDPSLPDVRWMKVDRGANASAALDGGRFAAPDPALVRASAGNARGRPRAPVANASDADLPAPWPSLNRASRVPLYRQLRDALGDAITAGVFDTIGRALPSSRALAAELGVSRNTVNLAYQELITQGLVESRPRSGLYPADHLARRRARPVPSARATPVWRPRPARGGRSERVDAADSPVVDRVNPHEFPYPFLTDSIDVEGFPLRSWLKATSDALRPPHGAASAHYSNDDDELLLEVIRQELLLSRGISASESEIIVTTGPQQARFLLGQVLLGAGRTVALENPGPADARETFGRAGARLVPMRVDECGAVPPELETADVIHLTPSHQRPTNVILDLERRHAFVNMANHANAIIIEDDNNGELRYGSRRTPPLKAIDTGDRVVYIGTFSAFLDPAFRLGFVVADAMMIARLRERRRQATGPMPGHAQRTLALFVLSGQYHHALRAHRARLRRKWATTQAAIATHLPWALPVCPSSGGACFWIEGPPRLDAAALAARAIRSGILLEAGESFFFGPRRPRHFLRLGFTAIREEAIPAGIEALGHVADALLARS